MKTIMPFFVELIIGYLLPGLYGTLRTLVIELGLRTSALTPLMLLFQIERYVQVELLCRDALRSYNSELTTVLKRDLSAQ